MPDPSLTCPCSALRSGVASRRLLPTQNSGEPQILTEDLILAGGSSVRKRVTGRLSRIETPNSERRGQTEEWTSNEAHNIWEAGRRFRSGHFRSKASSLRLTHRRNASTFPSRYNLRLCTPSLRQLS